MREILIFAGTMEGRKLSELLSQAGIYHRLCVATKYGEVVLKCSPFAKVRQGRMDSAKIREFIESENFLAVVDATHPYAQAVTENIKRAMENMEIPYLRLKRESYLDKTKKGVFRFFDTNKACAKALENTEGNILLTTGSKELSDYCVEDKVKSRLYVRVLPSMESLSVCKKHGICGKQIIAMQGPFTEQMNEAIIRQYEISCLVTKESGKSGGLLEKLKAAEKTGVQVFVVGRPKEEEGDSFSEICRKLEGICGQKICKDVSFQITLAGVGMGSKSSLTQEVQAAIEDADILLGAERMLAPYETKAEKHPYYLGGQIIPYLEERQNGSSFGENLKVTILFSGDSGFYSGCQKLRCQLMEEIEEGRLRASLHTLPGVSSIAALAARLGVNYQDAVIYSMHGKKLTGLICKIKRSPKTFLLMSGVEDVNWLGELLIKAGLTACEVSVGYQLSYEEEQVQRLSPKECVELTKEGLYTCMITNPHACPEKLTHGMADDSFIRGKVPMTKEEVREISICKMHLSQGAVVYDIGGGTGSVSIEIASLSDEIQVYAIEQKKEAANLIERNKEKFGCENVTVIEAKAPEGFKDLPAATHAFIGGSGGKLKEILVELYRNNPRMQIVINAVSLETICELKECLSACNQACSVTCGIEIEKEEIIQVQVSRAKKMGEHRLMQAENPIWICSFRFCVPEAK